MQTHTLVVALSPRLELELDLADERDFLLGLSSLSSLFRWSRASQLCDDLVDPFTLSMIESRH